MANQERILHRENVNKALQGIFSHPLTIVSAPMGYGKTMAVQDFFKRNCAFYKWVFLNEASADCGYFWNRLTREISADFKKMGAVLQGMSFPKDSIQAARVMETFWAMPPAEKYCLVLDDYHHAENEQLNYLIETIAKNEIPNFHMVIISRHMPKMNLAELMVKDLAVSIDTEYFRFSDEDTQRYFALMGFPLKRVDIPPVQEIAGGWVSALYLIYRGLKGGIPLENITSVEELLHTAIYALYDEERKTALCALATLDTFTMDLADKATGIKGIRIIIKDLIRENAFIQWDKSTGVYTIHHVFRRFLSEEAVRRGLATKEICRRAGQWYLDREDFSQAFSYFISGEAYDDLLQVLERPLLYISADDRPMLLQFFDAIPPPKKEQYPIGNLKYILLFAISGDREKGMGLLQQFEKGYRPEEHAPAVDAQIRASICLIKMFFSFNDVELMLSYVDTALKFLNGGFCQIANYQGPFSFGSPHFNFIYHKEAGAYRKIAELPFENYARLSGGCGTGSEPLSLAEYALETGNLAAVEDYAFKAIYRARTKEQTSMVVCATLTLARLYLTQNKYAEALPLLESLTDEVASNVETILLDTYDLCRGYFYACTGEMDKIPRWIREGDMSVNSLLFQGLVFSYIVYGKVLISSQDWVKTEALCETFIPYFDVFQNQLGYMHNNIHLSIAVYQQGDNEKAKIYLRRAIGIGQADRLVMPFVENSPHLLPMLKDIHKEDMADTGYLYRLIELCTTYAPVFSEYNERENPLSPREMEVLRLMGKGLSRKEIAQDLFLSHGTVRSHIQNIYNKLNVNKKSAALEKAAELNIL